MGFRHSLPGRLVASSGISRAEPSPLTVAGAVTELTSFSDVAPRSHFHPEPSAARGTIAGHYNFAMFGMQTFHGLLDYGESPRRNVPVSHTIALVDDDRNILTSVSMALEAEGFKVRTYTDGAEALRGLTAQPADLAVLDIKMPRMDGMELLQRLRKQSAIPVIFLTSKDDEIDELLGLRMGADDYIKKPFSQKLLIERIRALIRRLEANAAGPEEGAAEVLVRGELVLDSARHACTWKGRNVDLTVTEFLLLKSLAVRPGHVKNRDQLIDAAYGESIYVDDRTIDSHVKRLRKKFREVDETFAQIETLYGVGYRYSDG